MVTATYLVHVSGSSYVATNVASGATLTSGSNALTVIQAALNALTSGRTVQQMITVQGNIALNGTVLLPSVW
jgi:ATP-dependent Lon protease